MKEEHKGTYENPLFIDIMTRFMRVDTKKFKEIVSDNAY